MQCSIGEGEAVGKESNSDAAHAVFCKNASESLWLPGVVNFHPADNGSNCCVQNKINCLKV